MKRRDVIKICVLACLFLIGIIAYFTTGLRSLTISDLEMWIAGFGVLAGLIYIVVYAIGPLVLVPGSILTLAGGVLFGKWLGWLYVIIGSNIAANIAFILTRYLGRGVQDKIAKSKLKKYDDELKEHGFLTVLYLRLIPIFPFIILNYALGVTKVKHRDYFFATLLGMLPGTFAFVFLGDAIKDIGSKEFWAAAAFFAFMAIIPAIVKKYWGARLLKRIK